MDNGKRTFSLCVKLPFFSFTFKSGDANVEAMRVEYEDKSMNGLIAAISGLVAGFMSEKTKPKSADSNGGRGKTDGSRKSASA
jgi:hypothetical protein